MTPRVTTCFVLPAKNEEKSIGSVLDLLLGESARAGLEVLRVIIVDDSSDGTAEVARARGAEVIRGSGRGLGAAMYSGLKACAALRPDVIVSLDSDGQVDLKELRRFVEPIARGEVDFVVGSRFLDGDLIRYAYPRINRFGVRILSWILRASCGLPFTDSHGGFRAMRPEVAEKLKMIGTFTYVQETLIDAAENGFRIREIPSAWNPRAAGRSRVIDSIPQYVRHTLPVLVRRGTRALLHREGLL